MVLVAVPAPLRRAVEASVRESVVGVAVGSERSRRFGSKGGGSEFGTVGPITKNCRFKRHSSLRAWQFGKTGYPLVDAAMRELWVTGYMPNYTRHVVAGFLIEYLNVDWRHGQLWFHDTLVDADVAIQVQTVSLLSVSKYPITTQSPPNH